MRRKAREMHELLGQFNGPKPKQSLTENEDTVEVREELPPEILIDAKQDRVHTEKRSTRKVVVKRIHFR